MSDRDSDFGSFLSGFLVGGLVGAVVALLFAPQSGEETRTIIKEKSIEIKDKTVQTLEEAYARAEQAAVDARTKADELAKEAQRRAEELRQRGQVVLEEQRAKFSHAIDSAKTSKAKETNVELKEEPAPVVEEKKTTKKK